MSAPFCLGLLLRRCKRIITEQPQAKLKIGGCFSATYFLTFLEFVRATNGCVQRPSLPCAQNAILCASPNRQRTLHQSREFLLALEQYRSMGLDENDIGIDVDDLVQEGSIGLLNAIPLFDAGRGMKFLTYAAPAIRNAMTDCIRAALAQFEQRMIDKKDGPGFQRVYLDDILSDDERMLRIEAIADPHTQTPEQIYIQKEQLTELYAAMDKLTAREQTYLLYRYGFTDGIEHPLIGVALHFHLSESRTKKVEGEAMDSLRGKLPWWF